MTNIRVLVTGATGFVGKPAVEELLCQGYEVHIIGRHRPDVKGVWFHECDLLALRDLRPIVGSVGATHLLHLAWDVAPGKFWTDAANLDWMESSLRLFRTFADCGGKRIVAAGTCAEYDWSKGGLCLEHITPLAPHTLYGTVKHSLRLTLEAFGRQQGISTAWGRLFFLYGPHEAAGRLVPEIISSLLKSTRVAATEGSQVRDFMHVNDAGRAFAQLIGSSLEGPVNIGSGKPVSIRQLIELLEQITGQSGLVDFGAREAQKGDPHLLAADVTRLTTETGFRHRIPLLEGLNATVSSWRSRISNR